MIACFLSLLGLIQCALLIFESRMSIFSSFHNLLTFFRTFSDVSSFSHGMYRSFASIAYCIRPNVQGFYIFPEVLPLFQCIHVLLKQTDSRRELLYIFQFFLNCLPCFIFENLPEVRFHLFNKG